MEWEAPPAAEEAAVPVEPPAAEEPKEEPPAAEEPKEEPAAEEPVAADGGSKKRPLEEDAAPGGEEPLAKQPKLEEAAPAAAPASDKPRVRANQNHPAAIALRKRKSRKPATLPAEPEVLFPVGQSPADLHCPRRLRTATARRPRSNRAAWGRLKQVGRGGEWPLPALPQAACAGPCPPPFGARLLLHCTQHTAGSCTSLITYPRCLPLVLQAAHGTLPLGTKRSKSVYWQGAVEEVQPSASSSEEEDEEPSRFVQMLLGSPCLHELNGRQHFQLGKVCQHPAQLPLPR